MYCGSGSRAALFTFGPTAGQTFQLLPIFQTTSNGGRLSWQASNNKKIAYHRK